MLRGCQVGRTQVGPWEMVREAERTLGDAENKLGRCWENVGRMLANSGMIQEGYWSDAGWMLRGCWEMLGGARRILQ